MKVPLRSAAPLIVSVCFLSVLSACTGQAPESPPAETTPSPTIETPSPEIASASDYLKSASSELYTAYVNFGLDENVAAYITFAQSLPEDLANYALTNKLCIQDRELTELEKQFLNEPDQYLQQMLDSYMTEIGTVDPELATQLKKLPYFKTIELEDIEVLEDVLYLASNTQYRSALEKLYGKGIERRMWPVALEAMVYRGMRSDKNEFDVNNPLEGSELITLTRLADFQEKYNADMDTEGVPGPGPAVRGINYICEPRDELTKGEDDYKFDYALMRWVLRCNAVRLWNNGKPEDDELVFHHIGLARDEGLEIYLQFEAFSHQPDIDLEEYKTRLADFAKKAQDYNVKILSVGNEVEVWSQGFGGGPWAWSSESFQSRQSGDVERFVNELAEIARENYSGLISYTDYWAFWAPDMKDLDWAPLDIISLNIYKCHATDEEFIDYMLHMQEGYASPFNKPLYITETGSLTITEAEEAGGDDSYCWRLPVHYDPEKQAQVIDKLLKLIYQAAVDGVFVFCWDRSTWNNMNELGFGIWDYVKIEPKLSFWTVYKYYREG